MKTASERIVNVTEMLAQWLSGQSYESLPAPVREKSVAVILDSVGGMLACSTLPSVKPIVGFVNDLGGQNGCTIIGHRETTSVVNAAMANGGMAHGDEVDAAHGTTVGGHVAAGLVPAALAVGEWIDASGRDVVRAVALGYEVGGRLMTIFYREGDYLRRRFYPTSVIASLSSAVTAGVLLGFDAKTFQVALGLATYQAAGPDNMMRDPEHFGKTFQVAAASRNGVTAALFAHRGCHVPLDILDGTLGLFDAYLNKPELGAELVHDLGRYYSITDVMYKRYPAGIPNQTYLQGLFSLYEKHGISADDIAAIEIQMPAPSMHMVPKVRHPSIAANVVSAVAALEAKLDFYRIHDPAVVVTPAVVKMQEKIRFILRDDWTSMEHGHHAIVTITTNTGKRLEEDVWYRPMTRLELERKFDGLVAPQFGVQRARALLGLLQNIETASSIRTLMEKLRT